MLHNLNVYNYIHRHQYHRSMTDVTVFVFSSLNVNQVTISTEKCSLHCSDVSMKNLLEKDEIVFVVQSSRARLIRDFIQTHLNTI